MTWPNDLASANLSEMRGETTAPELYIRTQITKNTKGYSYETTASVKWVGTIHEGEAMLAELLGRADTVCRQEIDHREALDTMENDER